MMNVLIKGSSGEALMLSEQVNLISSNGSEHYLVTLTTKNFKVQKQVYAYDPSNNGLRKFFGELASSWRGWDGSKVWSSLEGEFSLACEHDGLGHVTVVASIRDHGSWEAKMTMNLVAPDFDGFARNVGQFFQVSH